MIFSQILEKRVELYKENKPEEIYSLYNEKSKLKEFFPTFEIYKKHFEKLINEHMPINVEVFRESLSEEKGEALYIEIFKYGNAIKKFYSKTIFIKNGENWEILEEKREEQYIKD